MNKRRGTTKAYNLLLPLWLLLCFPTPLWLVLIPANYGLDRLVLWWGLKGQEDRNAFCRKHTWKICLAGFFGDFVGVVVLICICFVPGLIWDGISAPAFIHEVMHGVEYEPFSNVLSLLLVLIAIAISALVIYSIDKSTLKKAGLDESPAKAAAQKLALITAPYLYLFPSSLLY